MSKHTPGPWIPEKGTDNEFVCRNKDGTSFVSTRNSFHIEETEANARLIAAAPCMLSALEEIVANYANYDEEDRPGFVSLAREVIAQAKGEK